MAFTKEIEREEIIEEEEESTPIKIGDVVAITNCKEIEAYIVKNIDEDTNIATVCGIQVTAAKDDIYVLELNIPIDSLTYIGIPFINVNGYLWNVRERILKGNPNLKPVLK